MTITLKPVPHTGKFHLSDGDADDYDEYWFEEYEGDPADDCDDIDLMPEEGLGEPMWGYKPYE